MALTDHNKEVIARERLGGRRLEDICTAYKINLAEAQIFLEESRADRRFDDDALAITATEALHYGLVKLIAVVQAPSRVSTSEFKDEGSDIEAAKALLRYALDVRKILGGKSGDMGKGAGEKALEAHNPWKLRE